MAGRKVKQEVSSVSGKTLKKGSVKTNPDTTQTRTVKYPHKFVTIFEQMVDGDIDKAKAKIGKLKPAEKAQLAEIASQLTHEAAESTDYTTKD